MCYSAEASFIASGVLTATSIAIARVPKEKASRPLSVIPAVFAAHQFSEGLNWLNQGGFEMGSLAAVPILFYVLIAYVFWPVFIPYAAYQLEADHRRRSLILVCQVVGLVVGANILLWILQSPVRVSVYACHLTYSVQSMWNIGAAYIVAVSVPFLISSQRNLVLFGMLVLAACDAGLYLASNPGFPSVWCFFAAILSISLYAYFREAQRTTASQPERSRCTASTG